MFNYDNCVTRDPKQIAQALLKGMDYPVLWASGVAKAVQIYGPCEFREIGGDVLKFGLSNENMKVGKVIRPIPEDISGFQFTRQKLPDNL